MARQAGDWLRTWLEYSSNIESPLLFRFWSGVSAISGVLQRKVFTLVKGQRLYPNLYVLLVGPPGIGKGNAMRELTTWLRSIDGVCVAPEVITSRRAFYEVLEGAKVMDLDDPTEVNHSLCAFIEELGVFLSGHDTELIYNLCRVFDTPDFFHYKTGSVGELFLEKACFSFLAGVTPKALRDIFTEQAMELGISARTIMAFSNEKLKVDIFGVPTKNEGLRKDLLADLGHISKLHGEIIFSPDAGDALIAWSETDFAPLPQDPRFVHYNTRRFVHIIKLCMIVALSRHDELIISLEDFRLAQTAILEVERQMPEAIRGIGANPYLDAQNGAMTLINKIFLTTGQPTMESTLYRELSHSVEPHYVDAVIEALARGKWIKAEGEKPERKFWPRGREKKED